MSTENKMTINERRKYLRVMRKRYDAAGRKERSRLLDEMEAVTGLHRKALVRLRNRVLVRKPRARQRGSRYGAEVDRVLCVIDETLDYICAERLKPSLVVTAEQLAAHGELELSAELLEALASISISTVRRHLTRLRQDRRRLPRKGPERAHHALREVPIRLA